MGLHLKNAEQIRAMWAYATDTVECPNFTGVLIRHAHKLPDGNARCGLSPLGGQQCILYRDAVRKVIDEFVMSEPVDLWSSTTSRNIDTLRRILPMAMFSKVVAPPALDLVDLGPNEEDLATCRILADELNAKLEPGQPKFTVNSVAGRLEEFGKVRVGETPAACEGRIQQWLLGAAHSNKLFIYSMNSPNGNRAVGVDGVLAELEALFVGYEPEVGFELLGRIAPEWGEIELPDIEFPTN